MKCDELEKFDATSNADRSAGIESRYAYDADEVDEAIEELKAEKQKLNEEKDAEIQRLENLCESYRIDCDNLAIREANAYKEIERADKKLRRHKYKRCLAMASKCRLRARWFGDNASYKKEQRALQWHRRWLAIAEKFKPNSTINKKGGTNALQR